MMPTEQAQLLVVEGDQTVRDSLVSKLEQLGYKTFATDDGYRALDILNANQAHLLILGTNVGGLDYTQLVERVDTPPGEPPIPILMLVTVDQLSKVTRAIDERVEDYLVLPLLPEILRHRIGDALAKRQLIIDAGDAKREMQQLSHELSNVILSIGLALASEKDMDKLLDRIVIEAQQICNADAGTLYLRSEDDHLRFTIMRTNSLNIAMGGTTGTEIPFPPLPLYDSATGQPNYHNVATSVALSGRSINLADVYTAEKFDFSATKKFDEHNGYRTASTIAIPLKKDGDTVMGVLQLINALDRETGETIPFSPQQQLMVELLASQTAIALNNQALLHRQAELLKFERDLQIGQQIQANFLPDKLPDTEGWEVAASFFPAREVAGDFYDAFYIATERIWICIADVCDKGVGAALFMALMRSLLRAYAQQTREVAHHINGIKPSSAPIDSEQSVVINTGATTLRNTIKLTNEYVVSNHGELNMFATMFCGVIDPNLGTFVYVNGGHNPPVLLDTEGKIKERFMPTGPAVGIMPGADFKIGRAMLRPGETLFLFTDGVTDARNPQGKLFTEKRMLEELQAVHGLSAQELLDHMHGLLHAHIDTASQFDDITMLAVRRKP